MKEKLNKRLIECAKELEVILDKHFPELKHYCYLNKINLMTEAMYAFSIQEHRRASYKELLRLNKESGKKLDE